MAYLACDKDGTEMIFDIHPYRREDDWCSAGDYVYLPHGSIAKLIGRELTWEDEPVELK